MRLTPDEIEKDSVSIWYQLHYCVKTSNKFSFVLDCAVQFNKGVNFNENLLKGHCSSRT